MSRIHEVDPSLRACLIGFNNLRYTCIYFYTLLLCLACQPLRALSHANGRLTGNYSEVVHIPTMGSFSSSLLPPVTDCPHHKHISSMTTFGNLVKSLSTLNNANIIIPANRTILLSGSDLAVMAATDVINRITVSSTASLIFNDTNMHLRVREIVVQVNGALLIGSPTCRLNSNIDVTFYGSRNTSSLSDSPTGPQTSKGILSYGTIGVHGKLFYPTWTRLAQTATANAVTFYLQDKVNWEIGQQVVLTTTVFFDCPDQYATNYCNGQRHQNEVRTIVAVSMNVSTLSYMLQVDTPLVYDHYANISYQGEVALLSRNIVFRGTRTGDSFGGHVKVIGTKAIGQLSGIQADYMGQLNVLGRYPFHFHMMRNSTGAMMSYFQDCSVTDSQFRSFVVHGTNRSLVSRNVAYNVLGMSYYLEDGVEEGNVFQYNIAIMTVPIYAPANGGWSQTGETFTANASLINPADTTASGFYVSNAMNTFIGNAASGGWSGFAFPNIPAPLGMFRGTLPTGYVWVNPLNRPTLLFDGNTAHSCGFYWVGNGGCIYIGAWLAYDAKTGILTYNSGRNNRVTAYPNGTFGFMSFLNTKIFLCNIGLAHWGDSVLIEGLEVHDTLQGAMLFGQGAISNALINVRSYNPHNSLLPYVSRIGFQFYDTWVQIILSNVTFRDVSYAHSDCALRYMDHSDHYLPQGINSVRGLKFQNVDLQARVCIQHCGAPCGTSYTTMSSRIYTIWDMDGSLTGTSQPMILGSNNNWWHVDDGCTYSTNWNLWMCPWTFAPWGIKNSQQQLNRTIGYIQPYVQGLYDGCDTAKFSTCTDQNAPYTVGRMNHWGKAKSVDALLLSPWAGVTGITNMGWYWRVVAPAYGIDGAPSAFSIGSDHQLARESFIVLAIAYPSTTKFTVTVSLWGLKTGIPMASSLADVVALTEQPVAPDLMICPSNWWSLCTYTGYRTGFSWFFDGSYLYIRMVPLMAYTNAFRWNHYNHYFKAYGGLVNSIFSGYKVSVNTTCTGCPVQSQLGSVTFYNVSDSPPPNTLANVFAHFPKTDIPTATPTPKTQAPTASTQKPTRAPSISTQKPTAQPTLSTSNPTLSTTSPTVVPVSTRKPTTSPTFVPSKTPTVVPSTRAPSLPLAVPSTVPSLTPMKTTTPSTKPSTRPSFVPSTSRTTSPTTLPLSARPSSRSPSTRAPI